MNTTPIPTVITVFHKNVSNMLFTYFKQAFYPKKQILKRKPAFVFVYIV